MVSNIRLWEGEEWEKHIQRLLKMHHGHANYQELPAKHVGDFGIEGYSMDGCAYQCYASQEPCTTNDRYVLQRDKITRDIGKFTSNKEDLVKLFKGTVIERWILVVPLSESALLMQHASKKAREVIDRKLPYVSDTFKIVIITDSCFEKEIKALTNTGVLDIEIGEQLIEASTRKAWIEENDGLVKNLDIKTKKIPGLVENEKVEEFKVDIVDHYLRGQNIISNLYKDYPDIYAKLDNCKRAYENSLRTMSLLNSSPAGKYFSQALDEYNNELRSSLPNLNPAIVQVLRWEAVSDWLLRCPLDF